MIRKACVFLLLLTVSGCFARGFDRAELFPRLIMEPIQVTDDEIAKVQQLKPQLTFPCRVAVYLPQRVKGHWRAKEKDLIDSWAERLKQDGIVADMFLMSDMITHATSSSNTPTLKDLRIAAAKHGAHALLVIQGDYEVDSYNNPAAVFNLTIVGGFIVPASHRNASVILQGALVDVGNGYLYAAIESQGEGRVVRPSFLVDEKPAVERARQRALENFGPELYRRMHAVYVSFNGQPVTLKPDAVKN